MNPLLVLDVIRFELTRSWTLGRGTIWFVLVLFPVALIGTLRLSTDEQDPQVTVAIPNWSPRGDRIVYVRHSPDRNLEQWVVDARAAEQQVPRPVCRTGGGAVCSEPQTLPDAPQIADTSW